MPVDGMLDALVALYGGSVETWLFRTTPATLTLFLTLATIQISWDALMWAVLDVPDVAGRAFRKFLVLSLLYTLIAALPFWLPPVLSTFEVLARQATGLAGLSPSRIFDQGLSLALSLFDSWQEVALLANPVAMVFRLVTFFVVLVAFTAIAVQMARVLVEGAVVLGGGVLFLGFAGHRATFGLSEGFIRYALDVGVRVYVVYLLVAVGRDLGATWDELVRSHSLLGILFFDVRLHFVVAASAFLFAFLVWSLPPTVSRQVTGAFSLSGHNPLADTR
jgi:type IV secretion system protein TrbL